MTHSPEALSSLEIPTVSEGMSYLKAASIVLGHEDVVHESMFASFSEAKHVTGGNVIINLPANEGFTMRWSKGPRGEWLALGQVLQDSDAATYLEVERHDKSSATKPAYEITKWHGANSDFKVAKTDAEKLAAEDLLVTMASDFKTALDRTLSDRTDLLDGIEVVAANLGHETKRSRLSKLLRH